MDQVQILKEIIAIASIMATEIAPTKQAKSTLSRFYDFTTTPFVGMANAACIMASPIISPPIKLSEAAIVQQSSNKKIFPGLLSSRRTYVGLTSKNALLFGAANLVGSWMIYDDDLEDGSGFMMAWSTLFLIVNGKNSLTALKYRKSWPLLLSSLAIANVGLYGRRFISRDFGPLV